MAIGAGDGTGDAVVHTPTERFDGISWGSTSSVDVRLTRWTTAVRMHVVDVGPREGPVALLLHGAPTWGYLYRKVAPALVEAGVRVVVPDLIGFGRSDKLGRAEDHTFELHIDWLTELLEFLELRRVTLFAQDWGALIGLRAAVRDLWRFTALIVSNTSAVPTGEEERSDLFYWFRDFALNSPEFDVATMMRGATQLPLDEEDVAAYAAPFPDEGLMAAPRVFPSMVPVSVQEPQAAENRRAWDVLRDWNGMFVTAYGDQDRINGGLVDGVSARVPNTVRRPLVGAGHFCQEDTPDQVVDVILQAIRSSGHPVHGAQTRAMRSARPTVSGGWDVVDIGGEVSLPVGCARHEAGGVTPKKPVMRAMRPSSSSSKKSMPSTSTPPSGSPISQVKRPLSPCTSAALVTVSVAPVSRWKAPMWSASAWRPRTSAVGST